MNILFAHPRRWEDDRIDRAVETLQAMWTREHTQPIRVVSGRDDYNLRARALGGWENWCRSVAKGTKADGEARFDVIIVPSDADVGKATADIARTAIQARRSVVQWDGSRGFTRGRTFRKVVWIEGIDWFSNRVTLAERLEPSGSVVTAKKEML